MNRLFFLLLAVLLVPLQRSLADEPEPAPATPQTVAQRLYHAYDAVQTLSCDIRRDLPLPDGSTSRMLSRVLYAKPASLNSETFSPVKRRTVSDGIILRQHIEGLSKGFSRPVADLDPVMRENLLMVPGSNANLLKPLLDLPETLLPPEDGAPVRAAYATPTAYTVLSLDGEGRWTRIQVYSSPAMTDLLADQRFSDFEPVAPGAWIATRQETRLSLDGIAATGTTRITHLQPGIEIPAAAFDGAAFFPGIEFVDSFDKIPAP